MDIVFVNKLLQQFGKRRVIEIAQNLKAAGKQVTGRTIRSLRSKTEKTSTGFRLQILGAPWILTLEPPGRKPTSPAKRGRLYGIILDWVKNKGIKFSGKSQKSTAWLISRKIDKEGVNVPNRYTPRGLLRDGEQEWTDDLKAAIAKEQKDLYLARIR